MHHDTALIALVAMGFVLAMAFGYLAVRVRLPPIVGYLLAGIAVGPFTPGFVGDAGLAGQLAEIGVILLMFGVGLHFSIETLLAVRWIAVPGAVGQIAVATAIGTVMAMSWGWSLGAGLVLGLALIGREHGGAAARASATQRAGFPARTHRRRLAHRRGPCDGAGAGVPAGVR